MNVKPWENKKCKVIGATVVTEDGVLVASCVTPDRAEYVCSAVNSAVELEKESVRRMKCNWCENEFDELNWLATERGYTFCCKQCEDNYYDDRRNREKDGRPGLFAERRQALKEPSNEG